jgi:putative transposase
LIYQGEPALSNSTLLDIAPSQQEEMLSQLRRARYGYLLALHILLLCASGRTPTEIADFLFCSRSSVYRTLNAYRDGSLGFSFDEDGALTPPVRTSFLAPCVKRSLLALLKKRPSAFGWCRTRWSCATLSVQLKFNRGVEVSADTVRRWLHELGYEWKRAKLAAKDDDPDRVDKLARIRWVFEHLTPRQVLLFVDELDINLLAKVGYEWMLKGEQTEVMTPGTNQKKYLAGALDIMTGKLMHCVWFSKRSGLFIELLNIIDLAYPARIYTKICVVADNYKIHKAKAVERWLEAHPRFEIVYLPTYCPRANPIERVFGDVHDKCTRNHKRRRLRDLIEDVRRHIRVNGPWRYKLSEIYYEPEVTAAVEKMSADEELKATQVYQSLAA